jgi:hypothetical protein
MNNNLFSMAAARTRFLSGNPCMRAYGDTSAIVPAPGAQRIADALKSTHVGFEQGGPPRGVPR